jgi:hypothetical protein
MKTSIVLSAAILALGCVHQGSPDAKAQAQAQATQDEARLVAALSGRVAGLPQDCVVEIDLGGTKSYGRGVILFTSKTGDVVYVNRPRSGCPEVSSGRAIRVRTPETRFCRGDIVTVFDPVSRMDYGSCNLGEFTPYRSTR